ncbi:MAG: TRAP transporter substrate-binding protein [Chloroherpetonaceae bacterium]|nr:TRAP transporter substrate-binding protein [Chloroherpetonaceae bacterium]MCS7211773.1 TRAP transporter substrate-binding protein [Chloroherpetonaceae bacterium]MDW8020470.1 TRAP transporter substrate-binding protein [Chloroherpetonaceae bacterium]MDW8465341.1 TRAP transporter substrate-binding protein [Chloroherpetonaceae bacterium]
MRLALPIGIICIFLFASCGGNPQSGSSGGAAATATQVYRWKLVTSWAPKFPVLGEGAERLAQYIDSASNGRLKIQVYGAGELVPGLEVFNAVSQGTAEMGHSAAYYWVGKVPAAPLFASIPFGLNAQQFNAWYYWGGGKELWEEAYAPHGVIPFLCGNTGVQMAGWFNKEIKSVADLKGLKMRIPGWGGKVIAKAGGSSVTLAANEIYTSLERGVVDAAEWIGPYHDYKLGLHKAAKYYYYPGWHEPGTAFELIVNKKAFDALPADLKQIIRDAAAHSNISILSEFEAKNNLYLQKLISEEKVQLRELPKEVLQELKRLAKEVAEEETAKDPLAKRAYESMMAFKKNILEWNKKSEDAIRPYLDLP